jgi:hypothetical protein
MQDITKNLQTFQFMKYTYYYNKPLNMSALALSVLVKTLPTWAQYRVTRLCLLQARIKWGVIEE